MEVDDLFSGVVSRGEALARGAVLAAVLLAGGLISTYAVRSPKSRLIFQEASAPWIMADRPVSTALEQWGSSTAPVTSFSTTFQVQKVPPSIALSVRAFGSLRVSLNETPVDVAEEPNWKTFARAEVAPLVRAGANSLRIDVANLHGPGLVSVRLEGAGVALASGADWMAQLESEPPQRALLADDVRPNPKGRRGEAPLASIAGEWLPISALFLVCGAAFLALQGRLASGARTAITRATLVVIAAGWVVLFALKFRAIPLHLGPDASSHAEYVQLLGTQAGLPLATDGWSTYHPPLFYLLTFWLTGLVDRLGASWASLAPKVIPFLAGLGNVWVAAALARRLLPSRAWLAAVFAGLLPMNVYMAAYLSNEGLHACLSAGCILVAVDLLLRDEVSLPRVMLLSVLLGLALLTKFTALVIAVFASLFVGLRLVGLYRRRPAVLAARLAALVGPMLAIAGWYYARNVAEFGRPLIGNWDLPGPGRTWWSQPGFHTPAYYSSFGECLVRPYLSAFTSFWDALYSTLWGDGQLAGAAFQKRPDWNYGFMSAGYLLALPATLLVLGGAARSARTALRGADARLRSAFALPVLFAGAMGLAIFTMTLALPYFGQAKAYYALNTTPVLALFFALGLGDLDRWLADHGGRLARAALFGWLGALFGSFFLAFAA